MDLSNMAAAVYLRKSRAEDGLSVEEVLSRHRETLERYAVEHGIRIVETYPEVASGESLYARPKMLKLLEDVEGGAYDCVLCMDMDRLSRGSMREQGIVLEAFKASGTLIVTPEKVYDLTDEADEEYAELKTFLSRREYKIINKRLRRGLQQSIADGCYVANAPYGYRRARTGRKPTLEIYEPEARFVRTMFELYAAGYGCVSVARQVNALGARPHRAREFSRNSVKKILDNPVYIGKVVWNQKSHIRKGTRGNGKHITVYNPKEKWLIVDGLHPAIVSRELWDKVQAVSEGRYCPSRNDGTVKSPLAGLILCENCGGHMQRLTFPKGGAYLICMRPGCCASAKYAFVEERVLGTLAEMLREMTMNLSGTKAERNTALETALKSVRAELAAAEQAKARLYDLVEAGAYSVTEFRERMDRAKARIAELERREEEARTALERAERWDIARQAAAIRTVLEEYPSRDVPGKNALLKSVISCVWYTKAKKTKPADFHLRVLLK